MDGRRCWIFPSKEMEVFSMPDGEGVAGRWFWGGSAALPCTKDCGLGRWLEE